MTGSLRSNRSAAGATAIAAREIIILTVFAAFAATQPDSLRGSAAGGRSTRAEYDWLVAGNGRISFPVAAIGDRVVAAGFSFDRTRDNAELALLADGRRHDSG
jgi:methylated-DNA-[protein]-cysteine S-methyltransferase